MRFFRRKENTGMPDMNTVRLTSVFPGFSIHPLPYEHSAKFIADGIDPFVDERKRLKNRTVDWLLHDMRDASIEADSADEISYGKRQFTNHTYCISTIIADNEGELRSAAELEELIIAEIGYYNSLEAEL